LQGKLLRVLQEKTIERIGGKKPIEVDVRFIAATNKDLQEAVQKGTFRSDLFYRLNVITLTIPPLRERISDLPLLVRFFCTKYSQKIGRKVLGVSPQTLKILMRNDWPGNVRELENVIERAVVLGTSELILPEDLPEQLLELESPSAEAPAFYQKI